MQGWPQSLAEVQQFLAQRQLQNEQDQQVADMPQTSPMTDPIAGSQMSGMMPTLMQLAQQGKGGGGNYSPNGNVITEHGVTGDPRAMNMLERVAQQYPQLWSHVISSYRTRAEQAKLYAAYKAGNGNLAAPPGQSNHETGLAFDIDASWINSRPGLRQMLDRLGGFPVGGEPWHWQPQFSI